MRAISRRTFLAASGALVAHGPLFAAQKSPAAATNVLFIVVDDLRPDLGCYGHPRVQTPNIDRLAQRGIRFRRNYCQQASGAPSRASVLTGLRPDATRVYDSTTHFRSSLPNAVTLPEHFKRHGYQTTAFGKVFGPPDLDDQASWSIPPSFSEETPGSQSWLALDAADNELADGKTADAAVAAMGDLRGGRFFVATGFSKPHLPFAAPKKYFDLYPPSSIKITEYPEPPRSAPDYALHSSSELRGYRDIPSEGPIPDAQAKRLIRAYYASISYVDAQIGRLLDGLEASGLAESTIVCLWSDNGFHLGDLGLWAKNSSFEAAVHTPMIIAAPGRRNRGRNCRALTEQIDLYPSLCDLCGVPIPADLEGSCLTPLIDDPERLWKRAVFSQIPRDIPGRGAGMGRSLRTPRYRYTEWTDDDTPYKASELYDYEVLPLETINVSSRPRNISLVNGLSGILEQGWASSLPPTDPRSSVKS